MKKIFIPFFLILVLIFLPFEINTVQASPLLEKGSIAPDFQLTTLDGKTISLSDFHGQTIILNFWASWCPPCKEEMPTIQQFYQKNKANNIMILSVNLTNHDSGKQKLRQFVQNYAITFPILLDEQGKVGNLYQILTIPTSFVIDPTGKIAEYVIGPLDQAKMHEMTKNTRTH